MFVLRTIFGNGIENNYILGNSYQYINKETNSLEFESVYKQCFDDFEGDCYGFVVGNDIQNPHPLWKGQKVFIMTDSGSTFSNLTFK